MTAASAEGTATTMVVEAADAVRARLGLRAMLAGTLANFLSATIAGILL